MTDQDEMQTIVEAADECWHTLEFQPIHCSDSKYPEMMLVCQNCHTVTGKENPPPTDLNELFRLAEKIGYNFGVSYSVNGRRFAASYKGKLGESELPADALRKAMYSALGHET